jgi:hypothetical protein
MTKKEIDYLEFLRGKIAVMEHLLAALVAIHSDSGFLVEIAKSIIPDPTKKGPSPSYRRGAEGVVKEIEEIVEVGKQAEREAGKTPVSDA